MPDDIILNSESLMAVGVSLRLQATEMPAGAPDPLEISGCGDGGVISAAKSFSMWAAVTGIVVRDGISTMAQQSDAVVKEYGDWDANTSKNLSKGI